MNSEVHIQSIFSLHKILGLSCVSVDSSSLQVMFLYKNIQRSISERQNAHVDDQKCFRFHFIFHSRLRDPEHIHLKFSMSHGSRMVRRSFPQNFSEFDNRNHCYLECSRKFPTALSVHFHRFCFSNNRNIGDVSHPI